MLPEAVDKILDTYAENKARCAHIDAQIKQLESEIEQWKRNAAEELSLPARTLDGMPRGGQVSDPTAAVAIRLANGFEPEEIATLRRRMYMAIYTHKTV